LLSAGKIRKDRDLENGKKYKNGQKNGLGAKGGLGLHSLGQRFTSNRVLGIFRKKMIV